MELNEIRRGGRVISTGTSTNKKTGTGLSSPSQAKADRLALSRQAVAYLEERNRQLLAEEQRKRESGSSEDSKLKLLEKGLKALNKCQKIYARVVKGDKVPPEDLRYLEKNDPNGYKLALATRRPNPHPKEWKSVLDDEDRGSLDSGEETSSPPSRPSEA